MPQSKGGFSVLLSSPQVLDLVLVIHWYFICASMPWKKMPFMLHPYFYCSYQGDWKLSLHLQRQSLPLVSDNLRSHWWQCHLPPEAGATLLCARGEQEGPVSQESGGRGIIAAGHFSSQKKETQRFSGRHEPVQVKSWIDRTKRKEIVVGDYPAGDWTGQNREVGPGWPGAGDPSHLSLWPVWGDKGCSRKVSAVVGWGVGKAMLRVLWRGGWDESKRVLERALLGEGKGVKSGV